MKNRRLSASRAIAKNSGSSVLSAVANAHHLAIECEACERLGAKQARHVVHVFKSMFHQVIRARGDTATTTLSSYYYLHY